jgi:hypothetical protein
MDEARERRPWGCTMADLFHEKARIYRMIARVERRARVKLTVHAGEMLAIPVMEQVEAGERVDWSVSSGASSCRPAREMELRSTQENRFSQRVATGRRDGPLRRD